MDSITEYFFDHFDAHPLCLGSLEIFYKATFYSSAIQKFLKTNSHLPYFIEFFEKIVLRMLKNYEKPERLAVLNESLNNVQNSDFQNNMKKLLLNLNSPTQTPKNLLESYQHLNLFSPNSAVIDLQRQLNTNFDLENGMPISNPMINNSERDFPNIRSPLKIPSVTDNIMNLSNTNNNQNNDNGAPKRNFKIPLLQIPTNITENCPVISRSTRRADPYKSFSTTSNRFSNSIDFAGKNPETIMARSGYINKNMAQDNNISILDNENSMFFDDNPPATSMGLALNSGKNSTEISSTEKMKILASQLGLLLK